MKSTKTKTLKVMIHVVIHTTSQQQPQLQDFTDLKTTANANLTIYLKRIFRSYELLD